METPIGVCVFGEFGDGAEGHADTGRARGGPGIERLGNSDWEVGEGRGEVSLGRENRTRLPEPLNERGEILKLFGPRSED